jgi:hypothetical protein
MDDLKNFAILAAMFAALFGVFYPDVERDATPGWRGGIFL